MSIFNLMIVVNSLTKSKINQNQMTFLVETLKECGKWIGKIWEIDKKIFYQNWLIICESEYER